MLKVERMASEKLKIAKNLSRDVGLGLSISYIKSDMGHIGVFHVILKGDTILSLPIDSAKGLRDVLTEMLEEEK